VQEIDTLKIENKDLRDQLKAYKKENQTLFENNKLLKKALYGQSSERVEDLPDQYRLFNETEELLKAPEKLINIGSYTKKKGKQKRQPFPEDLERVVEVNDLDDDEKFCSVHGELLKEIKSEVKEFLVTRPPKVKIRAVHTKRYTCACCDKPPVEPKSKSIIPGSIATEETLAFIIFSKYFQHLPLYRLEDLYKLYGIHLSRGVMASWMVNISCRLTPLYNVLEERMLNTGYIGIDETRVQVLVEKGRAATTKSSMWVRSSEELGIALFDYDLSKGAPAVNRLLRGYTGVIQADEHSCCNQIEKETALRLGCMMHARRRFKKALDVSGGTSRLALEGLSFFKRLYAFEENYKKLKLTSAERFKARELDHRPLLDDYNAWLLKNKEKVPPKSKIGNAINYSLTYWGHLTNYLKEGRFEIDNGFVERQIKQFALGRKNWLFSASAQGAEASSILYSLLVTIKLNKKDPYETLLTVLKKLPDTKTPDDWDALADVLLK
jgi:transposase